MAPMGAAQSRKLIGAMQSREKVMENTSAPSVNTAAMGAGRRGHTPQDRGNDRTTLCTTSAQRSKGWRKQETMSNSPHDSRVVDCCAEALHLVVDVTHACHVPRCNTHLTVRHTHTSILGGADENVRHTHTEPARHRARPPAPSHGTGQHNSSHKI